MAKMFYTIEEVCEKLGKSEDEVKEMARSGQIQEFRDRDKLMFKVEQIDLLASPEDDTGELSLALDDTGGGSGLGLRKEDTAAGSGLGLQDSAGGIPMADSREGTGISVFDTGHGEEEADQTQVADPIEDELSLEAVGSGSGLLDLTRESDDTSLGAELLEEVYSSDDNIEIPANASGLFEAAGADSPGNVVGDMSIGAMPMVVEAYDGAGSGLGVGVLVGAMASMICILIIVFVGLAGQTAALTTSMAENLWLWVGGLFAVTLICGVVGLVIGKATE